MTTERRLTRFERAHELAGIVSHLREMLPEFKGLEAALNRAISSLEPLTVVEPTWDERQRDELAAQERQRLRRRADLERRLEEPDLSSDQRQQLRAKWRENLTPEERRALDAEARVEDVPRRERRTVGQARLRP